MATEWVEYICLVCKEKFKKIYQGWQPNEICRKCGQTAQYISIVESGSSFGIGKFRDVTALVYDKKTGEPLWLDKKGKKIKYGDSQIRYDLKKDPQGWRATGKKVRATDRYGRKM